MPAIRIERVPVQSFGLGILGFDHLQLVFQPLETTDALFQESWHVIEGLREPDGHGLRLAVEGWHGGTTLAEANGGATGAELVAKIGTAADRGSREIATGADALRTWASLVSYAAEIELQRFPYVAYSLPGSPVPTINSSSLVGSLLYHAGMDIKAMLPYGLRWSPGLGTLLGTSGDDTLDIAQTEFTAVLGGAGRDLIGGSAAADRTDKLYGGRGDDRLSWSPGFNILHGGQPELAYAEDGTDTVNYSGAGVVRIEAGAAPLEHQRPDFITSFPAGTDYLFSIEELTWDDSSDTVVLGKGIGIARERLKLSLRGGDDFIDAGDCEFATLVDASEGRDAIVAGSASMVLRGGPGEDYFVVARAGGELTLDDAEPHDRLIVPWEFAEAYAVPSEVGDLLIRIRDHGARSAVVKVLHFRDGDLGISDHGEGKVPLEVDSMRALISPAFGGPTFGDPGLDYEVEVPLGTGVDDLRNG